MTHQTDPIRHSGLLPHEISAYGQATPNPEKAQNLAAAAFHLIQAISNLAETMRAALKTRPTQAVRSVRHAKLRI